MSPHPPPQSAVCPTTPQATGVLVVDPSRATREFITNKLFGEVPLALQVVEIGGLIALEKMTDRIQSFSLVLCADQVAQGDAAILIETLRRGGYGGPVVVFYAPPLAEKHAAKLSAMPNCWLYSKIRLRGPLPDMIKLCLSPESSRPGGRSVGNGSVGVAG